MPVIKGQEPLRFECNSWHWPFNLSSSKTRFMAFKDNLPDWKVKEIFNNIQSILLEKIIWNRKTSDVLTSAVKTAL